MTNDLEIYEDTELRLQKYRSEFQNKTALLIETLSPWPISYDVDAVQDPRFQEFTFTDTLRGFLINTQSIEINCRIMQEASQVHCDDFTLMDKLIKIMGDKYVLDKAEPIEEPYQIGFMVGQNMFDIVSNEVVARLGHENDDFYLKLHPLTELDFAKRAAYRVGWNRIIRENVSAYDLIKGAYQVWTSTASELTMVAVMYDKPVKNFSNFFNEAGGCYYPISRLLYNAEDPKQVLNNILNCEFSGLLVPGVKGVEKRVQTYFDNALEMRKKYGNLASRNELKKTPIKDHVPRKV